MEDREKVIKAWECCNPFNRKCKECPYEKDCYHDGISRHMVADALALLKEQDAMMQCIKGKCRICPHCDNCDVDENGSLKEQEAKNVVNMTLSKDCFLIASCPKCNALLTRVEHKNYCGYCGQAVKWE